MSIENETLFLSVYKPIAMLIVLGETDPEFGGGVELGGRVLYPVKLLHIRHNLFAGTEMLSLSVYESIAKEILHGGNRPPILGRDRAGGSGVAPRESPPY